MKEQRGQKRRIKRRPALRAGYTVEAAGVMSVVLVTIMILMQQAFRIHAHTAGAFALHEAVERERHAVEYAEEQEIRREKQGGGWELEITMPVFRPEETLRKWSLAEEKE